MVPFSYSKDGVRKARVIRSQSKIQQTEGFRFQRLLLHYIVEYVSSVPSKCQKKCTMLLRDKGLQSSLQKIVTFMFQALVLVHNIVTSVWYIYFCCTALCSLLLSFYSIVTHSKAGNCHFDVSGFYREAKYLHFLPVSDNLIKGT